MVLVRVVVDMREEALWRTIVQQEGVVYEKTPLDVGDVTFFVGDKEVITLERKSAEDLGASQRDGRYREQRARLLAKKGAGVAAGYLLEVGQPSPVPRSWCHGAFKEEHLRNTVLRLQMRYGLAVFQSTNVADTAVWIQRIAAALLADPAAFEGGIAADTAGAAAAYTESIHVKKATNMSADRVFATLLRTIPGVGPTAADAIVKHVGSTGFPGFYALTEAELAAIPQGKGNRKVGPAAAKKLWDAFHQTASTETAATADNSIREACIEPPDV